LAQIDRFSDRGFGNAAHRRFGMTKAIGRNIGMPDRLKAAGGTDVQHVRRSRATTSAPDWCASIIKIIRTPDKVQT